MEVEASLVVQLITTLEVVMLEAVTLEMVGAVPPIEAQPKPPNRAVRHTSSAMALTRFFVTYPLVMPCPVFAMWSCVDGIS
jgi:hypothetical protein